MTPKIDLILPGFSMGTDQGNLAFCGVTLIEGTKRILVDVSHYGRRQLLIQKLAERGLTPADIDKFLAGPSNRHYDCTYPHKVIENGVIRMSGSCVKRKGGGGEIQVSGEGVYTSTSFKITATLATELAGIPLSGRASTEAVRIGDTCPDKPDA